jgi:hypothetical protein
MTFPFGEEDHPVEVRQPSLAKYKHDKYFYVLPDESGVAFYTPTDGVTTENSSNCRTEARERPNGENAAWNSGEGRNSLFFKGYVVHSPEEDGVVIAQVHDDEDDVVMVKVWPDGRVTAEFSKGKGKGSVSIELEDNYKFGTPYIVHILTTEQGFYVTFNHKTVSKGITRDNCYFKFGSYPQSNAEGDYALVVIIADSLHMSHT